METILIIDDDNRIIETFKSALSDEGYNFITRNNGADLKQLFISEVIDLVLLDVFLGQESGTDILKKLKAEYPDINIIMISGESDIETAINAIRSGAYDFLEKPVSRSKLRVTIKNVLADSKNRTEKKKLLDSLLSRYKFTGKSSAIIELEKKIVRAAPTGIPILITGENGTGKEIAAHLLHYHSNRAASPFVALNCASIPSELLESELFGHKRGSFTGAHADREGVFLHANGGTLFLDEIGDMPVELQPKLLRALQEKEITHIGDTKAIAVDVRIIAATNRNLLEAMANGLFREDLFFRLNGLELHMPSLRERKEDIPDLLKIFTAEFCNEYNMPYPEISDEAISNLQNYNFPGNVRELKNIVQRTLVFEDSGMIKSFLVSPATAVSEKKLIDVPGKLQEVKRVLLMNYLEERLNVHKGNRHALADELGIHVNNLYRLLKSSN